MAGFFYRKQDFELRIDRTGYRATARLGAVMRSLSGPAGLWCLPAASGWIGPLPDVYRAALCSCFGSYLRSIDGG